MPVYQIKVGYVYKFIFNSLLESINGPYRVNNILVLDDLISSKIDLFKHTFEKIGVSKSDYKNIVLKALSENDRLFKLIDVYNVETSYYIPEELIPTEPIHGIKPYIRLGLAVNLGIFNNQEDVRWLKNEIEDMLKGKAGIKKEAVLFGSSEVWLSPREYKVIDEERKKNIEDSDSIYRKNELLEQELSNLRNLISDYENTLINL